MKQNDNKQDDPLPNKQSSSDKDALKKYNLFYEAIKFEPSYADRLVPRLRRYSKAQ